MIAPTINMEKRRSVVFLIGVVCLVAAILSGLMLGSAEFSLKEVRDSFLIGEGTDAHQILHYIRTPRVITAALAGLNLALAGCILQGVLKNPLADPGIIGVSAGAGLTAMAVMILAPEHTSFVPLAAFVGALIASALVCVLSWENGIRPLRLVLAGVAIGAFFGGGMTALMVFHADKVQGTVNWMAGGFQGRSWTHVEMILPYTIAGIMGVWAGCRWLNALQLGDEVAKGLGVRVELVRFLLVTLAALLAASAVSVAGMLGFVGLIVPHMVRMLVGSDFSGLLPCAAVFGAALVAGADTAARCAFDPVEVPVGLFMSFLGAPFFLYLLRKGMRGR